MRRTILLAISSTIQNRRNFFHENWVWNHFARILMCLVTTSLILGCIFLANLWWTTGILRELSWGGGPSLLGLGLGFGAIVTCQVSLDKLSQNHCIVTCIGTCRVSSLSRRGSHITQLGDVNALAVSPQLIGSSRGAGLCSAGHTHTLRTGQPGLSCADWTIMPIICACEFISGPRSWVHAPLSG